MKIYNKFSFPRNKSVITNRNRTTHMHVIGEPGTGKSRAIESWVMQDVIAGRGVGVIDPHGELFNNLLARIARHQQVWGKVIIIDPTNPSWTVGFNPLAPIRNIPQERIALYLTDVVIKLWHIDPTSAPRMVWLVMNTFLALSELDLTLVDLPRFLLDTEYRNESVLRLNNPDVQRYFLHEFPKNQKGSHQWVMPVMNKLGGLLFDHDIRSLFEGEKTIDFQKVMDRRNILLVNLPKGQLGEGMSSLVAAFIIARIQQAALARDNNRSRPPFYLYLDEFQNYTTDNIEDILAKSRKYALSLTLAHQYLGQLSSSIKQAVLNTTGSLVCFRVGYQDASRLAKVVFPSPDFLFYNAHKLELSSRALLPQIKIKRKSENKSWESLAQTMAALRNREFWYRKRGSSIPTKHRTITMPNPIMTGEVKKRIDELVALSGRNFGKVKHRQSKVGWEEKGFQRKDYSDGGKKNIPFWHE